MAQLSVSLTLVVATALLLKSFVRLSAVDLGFDPKGVLAGHVPVPGSAQPGVETRVTFARRLTERLEAVPGITTASVGYDVPLRSFNWLDVDPAGPVERFSAGMRVVTPGFVEALDIPVVEGRSLTWPDLDRTDRVVALVDETFAARAWPDGGSAIGRTVTLDVLRLTDDRDIWNGIDEAEIVGVVSSGRTRSAQAPDPPSIFVSLQLHGSIRYVIVETEGDPSQFTGDMTTALAEIDKSLPFAEIWALEDAVRAETRPLRFSLTLMGAFAAVALVLAAVGLYSVLAHTVIQRRAEFGIRLALGATARDVVGLVARTGAVLAGAGFLAGAVGSTGLAGFIESQLYGVRVFDPFTYLTVAAILAGVAALAILVPARRASRVAPMDALRTE